MKLKLFGREIISLSGSKVTGKGTLSSIIHDDRSNVSEIKADMLRKIVLREPLIFKAIWKKNKDTFKNGYNVLDVATNEELIPKFNKYLNIFNKKTDFFNTFTIGGICANIYGIGFVEKIYKEDDSISAESKPNDSVMLIDLELLNSENISRLAPKMGDVGDKFYHYAKGSETIYIHPSRIEPVVIDKLPFSKFGISKVALLVNVLKSKMNFDISSGEYLNWGGLGMFDLLIKGMTDAQEEAAKKTLKTHPDFLVHDEDYELKVENPKSLSPADFINYFYVNIAAAIEMPKNMLTGGEMGNITGSEVGLSSYYSDIENNQKILSTPILNIYEEILKRNFGIDKELELDWHETFIDELSEAKILQTRSYSAVQCVNSGNPIIDVSEARKMLRDGYVDLDINKVPEIEGKPVEPSDPNIEPQPVIKPTKKDSKFKELSPLQKTMIAIEQEIGKREIVEQDARLGIKKKEQTKLI